jgi:hypothetical protein
MVIGERAEDRAPGLPMSVLRSSNARRLISANDA